MKPSRKARKTMHGADVSLPQQITVSPIPAGTRTKKAKLSKSSTSTNMKNTPTRLPGGLSKIRTDGAVLKTSTPITASTSRKRKLNNSNDSEASSKCAKKGDATLNDTGLFTTDLSMIEEKTSNVSTTKDKFSQKTNVSSVCGADIAKGSLIEARSGLKTAIKQTARKSMKKSTVNLPPSAESKKTDTSVPSNKKSKSAATSLSSKKKSSRVKTDDSLLSKKRTSFQKESKGKETPVQSVNDALKSPRATAKPTCKKSKKKETSIKIVDTGQASFNSSVKSPVSKSRGKQTHRDHRQKSPATKSTHRKSKGKDTSDHQNAILTSPNGTSGKYKKTKVKEKNTLIINIQKSLNFNAKSGKSKDKGKGLLPVEHIQKSSDSTETHITATSDPQTVATRSSRGRTITPSRKVSENKQNSPNKINTSLNQLLIKTPPSHQEGKAMNIAAKTTENTLPGNESSQTKKMTDVFDIVKTETSDFAEAYQNTAIIQDFIKTSLINKSPKQSLKAQVFSKDACVADLSTAPAGFTGNQRAASEYSIKDSENSLSRSCSAIMDTSNFFSESDLISLSESQYQSSMENMNNSSVLATPIKEEASDSLLTEAKSFDQPVPRTTSDSDRATNRDVSLLQASTFEILVPLKVEKTSPKPQLDRSVQSTTLQASNPPPVLPSLQPQKPEEPNHPVRSDHPIKPVFSSIIANISKSSPEKSFQPCSTSIVETTPRKPDPPVLTSPNKNKPLQSIDTKTVNSNIFQPLNPVLPLSTTVVAISQTQKPVLPLPTTVVAITQKQKPVQSTISEALSKSETNEPKIGLPDSVSESSASKHVENSPCKSVTTSSTDTNNTPTASDASGNRNEDVDKSHHRSPSNSISKIVISTGEPTNTDKGPPCPQINKTMQETIQVPAVVSQPEDHSKASSTVSKGNASLTSRTQLSKSITKVNPSTTLALKRILNTTGHSPAQQNFISSDTIEQAPTSTPKERNTRKWVGSTSSPQPVTFSSPEYPQIIIKSVPTPTDDNISSITDNIPLSKSVDYLEVTSQNQPKNICSKENPNTKEGAVESNNLTKSLDPEEIFKQQIQSSKDIMNSLSKGTYLGPQKSQSLLSTGMPVEGPSHPRKRLKVLFPRRKVLSSDQPNEQSEFNTAPLTENNEPAPLSPIQGSSPQKHPTLPEASNIAYKHPGPNLSSQKQSEETPVCSSTSQQTQNLLKPSSYSPKPSNQSKKQDSTVKEKSANNSKGQAMPKNVNIRKQASKVQKNKITKAVDCDVGLSESNLSLDDTLNVTSTSMNENQFTSIIDTCKSSAKEIKAAGNTLLYSGNLDESSILTNSLIDESLLDASCLVDLAGSINANFSAKTNPTEMQSQSIPKQTSLDRSGIASKESSKTKTKTSSKKTDPSLNEPKSITKRTQVKRLTGTAARTRITKPEIKIRHERIDSSELIHKRKKRWILNTEFESLFRKVQVNDSGEKIEKGNNFITNLLQKANDLLVNCMVVTPEPEDTLMEDISNVNDGNDQEEQAATSLDVPLVENSHTADTESVGEDEVISDYRKGVTEKNKIGDKTSPTKLTSNRTPTIQLPTSRIEATREEATLLNKQTKEIEISAMVEKNNTEISRNSGVQSTKSLPMSKQLTTKMSIISMVDKNNSENLENSSFQSTKPTPKKVFTETTSKPPIAEQASTSPATKIPPQICKDIASPKAIERKKNQIMKKAKQREPAVLSVNTLLDKTSTNSTTDLSTKASASYASEVNSAEKTVSLSTSSSSKPAVGTGILSTPTKSPDNVEITPTKSPVKRTASKAQMVTKQLPVISSLEQATTMSAIDTLLPTQQVVCSSPFGRPSAANMVNNSQPSKKTPIKTRSASISNSSVQASVDSIAEKHPLPSKSSPSKSPQLVQTKKDHASPHSNSSASQSRTLHLSTKSRTTLDAPAHPNTSLVSPTLSPRTPPRRAISSSTSTCMQTTPPSYRSGIGERQFCDQGTQSFHEAPQRINSSTSTSSPLHVPHQRTIETQTDDHFTLTDPHFPKFVQKTLFDFNMSARRRSVKSASRPEKRQSLLNFSSWKVSHISSTRSGQNVQKPSAVNPASLQVNSSLNLSIQSNSNSSANSSVIYSIQPAIDLSATTNNSVNNAIGVSNTFNIGSIINQINVTNDGATSTEVFENSLGSKATSVNTQNVNTKVPGASPHVNAGKNKDSPLSKVTKTSKVLLNRLTTKEINLLSSPTRSNSQSVESVLSMPSKMPKANSQQPLRTQITNFQGGFQPSDYASSPEHSVILSEIDQANDIGTGSEHSSPAKFQPYSLKRPRSTSEVSVDADDDEERPRKSRRKSSKDLSILTAVSEQKYLSPETESNNDSMAHKKLLSAKKRLIIETDSEDDPWYGNTNQNQNDEAPNTEDSQAETENSEFVCFESQGESFIESHNTEVQGVSRQGQDTEGQGQITEEEGEEANVSVRKLKSRTSKTLNARSRKKTGRRGRKPANYEPAEVEDGDSQAPEKCLNCEKQFLGLAALKKHMMSDHTKVWSRVCPEGKDDQPSLRKILKATGSLTCQGCGKLLKFIPYYHFHLKWCGRENEQEQCNLCGKFVKSMWMSQHERDHRLKEEKLEMLKRQKAKPVAPPVEGKRKAAIRARTTMHCMVKELLKGEAPSSSQVGDKVKVGDGEEGGDGDEDGDYSHGEEESMSESESCSSGVDEDPLYFRSTYQYSNRKFTGETALPTDNDKFDDVLTWYQTHPRADDLHPGLVPTREDWIQLNEELIKNYFARNGDSHEFVIKQMKVNCKTSITSTPQTLHIFQSFTTKDQVTSYCGATITAVEWCPLPIFESANQYAAVVCNMTSDQPIKVTGEPSGQSVVQIWKFGDLNPLSKTMPEPVLCYIMLHDGGCVTSISWCPQGAWQHPDKTVQQNVVPRLGLLAVSSLDGHVRVYSIPHPDRFAPNSNFTNPILFKPKPCLILKNVKQSDSGGCLVVSWQPTGVSNLIMAGYAKGLVRIWNMSSTSPLLVSETGSGVKMIHPIRSFLAHSRRIRCLEWHQKFESVFVTSSDDKRLKFWHLENLFQEHDNVPVFTPVTCIKWPLNETGVVYGKDHIFLLDKCSTGYQDCGLRPTNIKYTPTNHIGSIWDIDFIDWYNILLACDTTGTLRGARLRDMSSDDINLHAVAHREFPIYSTDIKARRPTETIEPDENCDYVTDNNQSITSNENHVTNNNQSYAINLDHVTDGNQLSAINMDNSQSNTKNLDQNTENNQSSAINTSHENDDNQSTTVNNVQNKIKKKKKKKLDEVYNYNNFCESQKKCCLIFTDNPRSDILAGRKKKTGLLVDCKRLACYPIESLRAVSANKNVFGSTWILSGGEAGLLRLHNLPGIMTKPAKSYFTQITPKES
ncbi:mucin-2 [Patella vulgata]|uniref:mucin-2 n=1 Tax=Patella vulgata TaxID=6465 RepID=UPI0021801E74|nr:mucin-2 [Patella vulgata]